MSVSLDALQKGSTSNIPGVCCYMEGAQTQQPRAAPARAAGFRDDATPLARIGEVVGGLGLGAGSGNDPSVR